MNVHTHIHTQYHIQPLDHKLVFPSQDPCTSKWKMLRKQSKWQTKLCAVWSYSIFPSQVTNCTERATSSFPLFFWCSSLQWLKRPNKHEKATCDSYILPQKRRCPEASLKCLYTNLHRLDNKQGELEVYRELQGWELAWNHRERVGQGSWLRHGHWRIQLVPEGKGWSGRRVTLHIIEFLDCIKCQHGTKSLSIDNL